MILVYLLVLHFVADFILQSREMGKKKSAEIFWLAKHLSIQFLVFLCGLLFFTNIRTALAFSLANTAIHGIIDWNIWRLYKLSVYKRDNKATAETWKYWEDHLFYTTIGFDQLLHTATIILLAKVYL